MRDTHECKTDPDATLYKKSGSGGWQLCHMGHVLMENRNGLPVAALVTEAITDAEWKAALEMLKAVGDGRRVTVGADAGYDEQQFVEGARAIHATPHVTQHTRRATHIDGRTTRHAGYAISLHKESNRSLVG